MEGMNQFWIEYIYTWKSHNEILCIVILNKNVVFQNGGQEGKADPVVGLAPQGRGGCKERV
jgi:hypothetical protein